MKSWFSDKTNVFILGLILTLVSISFSRALLSIGMFVLLIPALFLSNPIENVKQLKRPVFAVWIAYFFFHLLFLPFDHNPKNALNDLQIKIPILILPLAFTPQFSFDKSKINLILKSFAVSIIIVSLLTLINYLIHFKEMNERILESKEVPVITGITHIYFSMMLSFVVFLCLHLAFETKNREKKIWYFLSIFAWFCLHLFATRTGLAAFYFAVLVIGFYFILLKKMYKTGLGLILSFILIPVAAYFALPSFHNRIQNSLEDVKRFQNHDNISNRSISLRFAVWQTSYHLIQKHPLGVGMGDIDEHLDVQYELEKFDMLPSDRLHDLHNQFLECTLGLGIPGLIIFLLGLLSGFQKKPHLLFLAFFSVCLMSFMVESALERQWGIAFFFIFWFFLNKTNDHFVTNPEL